MRVAGDHIYRIHHSRTAAFAGRLWEDRALHGLYPDSPSLHGQRAGDVADTEEGAGPAGFFFCILCEYGDCAGAVCGNVCGGAVDRGFLSHAGSIVGCPCAEPCPRRKCAAECAAGVCVEAYDLQALLLFDGGASLVSAVVGIFMAYQGCGIWALVAQQLLGRYVGGGDLVADGAFPSGTGVFVAETEGAVFVRLEDAGGKRFHGRFFY